jgi:hypothetical protein
MLAFALFHGWSCSKNGAGSTDSFLCVLTFCIWLDFFSILGVCNLGWKFPFAVRVLRLSVGSGKVEIF